MEKMKLWKNIVIKKSFEEELPFDEPKTIYEWTKSQNRKDYKLTISKDVFEDDNRLKFIRKSDWSDDYVSLVIVECEEDEVLPF